MPLCSIMYLKTYIYIYLSLSLSLSLYLSIYIYADMDDTIYYTHSALCSAFWGADYSKTSY